MLEHQSDLLTLRGWLALEAGHTRAARNHLDEALKLATFPGEKGKPARRVILRSQGLASVCLDLLNSGEGKGK
jgi:hypothetical protein